MRRNLRSCWVILAHYENVGSYVGCWRGQNFTLFDFRVSVSKGVAEMNHIYNLW